jgi:DNA-binding response OmpR family regulator
MIIALTGLGSATTRKEAFDSGINMFLTKPVRFKDMREILDGWAPGMGTDICQF